MNVIHRFTMLALVACAAAPAYAQSFRVQCPASTNLHPRLCSGAGGGACKTAADCGAGATCDPDPSYPGKIKCQEVAGGDGYATMGDGTQIYLFGFGPLSGMADLQAGLPGTQVTDVFNVDYSGPNYSAAANTGVCSGGFNTGKESCQALTDCPDQVGTDLSPASCDFNPNANLGLCLGGSNPVTPNKQVCTTLADCPDATSPTATCTHLPSWALNASNGAVKEPAGIIDMGVLAANAPAPLMAIDEDDEFFLTLSNAGMVMRPDLFEQHTIHFHGYPNASSFFDGVPDASIAINIAGSFTYYYTAPDAGSYFWHCHIAPPEHLQMGMVGQLYVRPRQNRVAAGGDLRTALVSANLNAARPVFTGGVRVNPDGFDGTKGCSDILCTGQTPAPANGATGTRVDSPTARYAYNDGDGSTLYHSEYPIQLMGFDPNFHYVGMTFNPEEFAGMKDKYFLLSGRGYPDTVNTAAITTMASDGVSRPSQPIASLITIKSGERALLRISDLSVTEHTTIGTVGIPMTVIAQNARLLRDTVGNNLYYRTNSITLGGGESADVILDSAGVPPGTYFLYSTNLDHLSNDAENFGGMMTEIVVN